jgi:hypothetical protein
MTPSQEKAVERIRRYFTRYITKDLYNFDVRLDKEIGKVFVAVNTHENYLISEGGHFVIGRRGKIVCLSVHSMCRDKEDRARHYERMM